jgi:hypothetical protein
MKSTASIDIDKDIKIKKIYGNPHPRGNRPKTSTSPKNSPPKVTTNVQKGSKPFLAVVGSKAALNSRNAGNAVANTASSQR